MKPILMSRSMAGSGGRSAQRGLSLISLIILAVIAGLLIIVGARVVPTVTEYMAINKAAKKAAAEGTTVADVRRIFDHAQAVDYFDAVMGKDLEVTKNGDQIIVHFAYDKQIHLAGPAYLLLKYEGGTEQGYR